MFKFVRLCMFLLVLASCAAIPVAPGQPPSGSTDPCGGAQDCISFAVIIRCITGHGPPPRYPRLVAVLFDSTVNTFVDYPMLLTDVGQFQILYEGAAEGLDTSHVYQVRFRSEDHYISDWSIQVQPPAVLSGTLGVECNHWWLPLVAGRAL